MRHLDLDLLHSFVAIVDHGGFTQASKRVHRTQSAVSLQMRRLESIVGAALFKRAGRHMEITNAGDLLLNHARKLLALNDETLHALRGMAIEGAVRLGAPTDVAEDFLPSILKEFCTAHARVKLEVVVERSRDLIKSFRTGQLDLAVALTASPEGELLGKQTVVWMAARDFRLPVNEAVPLVLLDAPCLFRDLAINALEARRIPWRIAYSTASLSGLRAAVKAELGVTPRTAAVHDSGLQYITSNRRLPALGRIGLSLFRAKTPESLAIAKLGDLVKGRLSAALRNNAH